MALDLTGIVTHIQIDREHVTPEDEENARRLNEALRSMAEASVEFSATVTEAGLQFFEWAPDHIDESHGMTLEELIPETIDEWKRIRDQEKQ